MDIFNYTDYRKFLNDYYLEKKSCHRHFTVRYIAKEVGFKSASFFSQLVRGRSNISLELAGKFSTFMNLTKTQSAYFETLILYNQARSHEEKRIYFEKLTTFRQSKIKQIDAKYFEFYDKWYYSALRELFYIYPFDGKDYKGLAKLLEPSISPQQARRAVARLEKWGLIRKDQNGFYVRSDNQSISTGLDAHSFYINNYQRAVLNLAKEAIDNFAKDSRQFSTLTLSLSPSGYKNFLWELQEFRHKLLSLGENDSEEDRIYQLNIQLFPLSKQLQRKKP
ncbi:MAG: TIGR02147 family protein [Chitinispirillaceae bacterium]